MASAELAVAIPALVLVLAVALMGLRLGVDTLRCTDAARVGARVAARGEGVGAVRSAVLRDAPAGSAVSVSYAAGLVRVAVAAPGGSLARWGIPPPSASATAPLEEALDAPRASP